MQGQCPRQSVGGFGHLKYLRLNSKKHRLYSRDPTVSRRQTAVKNLRTDISWVYNVTALARGSSADVGPTFAQRTGEAWGEGQKKSFTQSIKLPIQLSIVMLVTKGEQLAFILTHYLCYNYAALLCPSSCGTLQDDRTVDAIFCESSP